jgi:hypothetical protein
MTSRKVCDMTKGAENVIRQITGVPSIFADLLFHNQCLSVKMNERLDFSIEVLIFCPRSMRSLIKVVWVMNVVVTVMEWDEFQKVH